MDLQSLSGKAVTSGNVCPPDNFPCVFPTDSRRKPAPTGRTSKQFAFQH